MTTPLLTTKLYTPPARPNLVARPRLTNKLEDGIRLGHRLTLISAPAGFGKSTLMSEWAQSIDQPVAWLSLDANDNNLKRFLFYLIAALQLIDELIGESVLPVLEATDNPPVEHLLTILINEIAESGKDFLIFIDDFHLITSPKIIEALEFFLHHLPPNAHLVISGRVDPPFTLSRLRARDQMTEIRSKDLRFTQTESAAFLNERLGMDLSTADILALLSRTEGWITGLQLAALSMDGRENKQSTLR